MTPDEMAQIYADCFENTSGWAAQDIKDLLGSKGSFAISVPSGFLIGRALFEDSELLTLAVAPQARRQGKARDLLTQFGHTSIKKGANHAFLEVAADNPAAIKLYEQAGYTPQGQRKNYYARPQGARVDALVMTKDLCLDAGAA